MQGKPRGGRRRRYSRLYCAINGFMFGVFLEMSRMKLARKRYPFYRSRMQRFLDEIGHHTQPPLAQKDFYPWASAHVVQLLPRQRLYSEHNLNGRELVGSQSSGISVSGKAHSRPLGPRAKVIAGLWRSSLRTTQAAPVLSPKQSPSTGHASKILQLDADRHSSSDKVSQPSPQP